MNVSAAVVTAKATAAISTILLRGPDAAELLAKVFEPSRTAGELTPGQIAVGRIHEAGHTLDHVAVACEGPQTLAIHCHGNPLIVEMVMKLLLRQGASLVEAEQMLAATAPKPTDTIAAEVRIALSTARTITAARIIASQKTTGLAAAAGKWLNSTPQDITARAAEVIAETARIRPVLEGCRAVLVGPPNSGKSTLLNHLAGRNKAIVTDTPGTTRDWVSAECLIEPLSVTLIDTAGLDAGLCADDGLERTAQKASMDQLARADIALLVLDRSRPADQLDGPTARMLADIPTITVANKSDLPAVLNIADLPDHLRNVVEISAAEAVGIDELLAGIVRIFDLGAVEPERPVCFTRRQQQLLQRLTTIETRRNAVEIITELLEGPLCV